MPLGKIQSIFSIFKRRFCNPEHANFHGGLIAGIVFQGQKGCNHRNGDEEKNPEIRFQVGRSNQRITQTKTHNQHTAV